MAAVLAVFAGALNCDFVNYDDPTYITSNAQVKHGLTLARISLGAADRCRQQLASADLAFAHGGCQSLRAEPAGHHLSNVLFHAANAVLLFLLLRDLTGAIWRSAMVAALFALHPLRVESVVWISERKDVLSTLFWILTVWSYARYAGQRIKLFYMLLQLFVSHSG